MNQLEDPVEPSETTVVGDKADKVSSSVVSFARHRAW